MSHHDPVALPDRLVSPIAPKIIATVLLIGGIGAFAWNLYGGHSETAWGGYLIGLFFFLGLGVFGALWNAIQYLTRAAWSVTMRRIPEAMAAWILPSAILAPLTALGAHTLYHWSHEEAVAADALLTHKSPFLNLPAFVAVIAATLVVYAILARVMTGNSRQQDKSGKSSHTFVNVKLSAIFALFFAPSFSALSFYLLMSLEPHWFSTMFAVLCFTDLMQTGLAAMSLVVAILVARGALVGFLDRNHLHDITKMTYAFTGFWAYIYFCQFMLIWYANQAEETTYFLARQSNGWGLWLMALPVLKFVVPFLVLTPRERKRSPILVIVMMVWILLAQFVELFVMVAPALRHGEGPSHAYLPGWEFAIFLGFAGAFYLVASTVFSRHAAVPGKDPYLGAAMGHHV